MKVDTISEINFEFSTEFFESISLTAEEYVFCNKEVEVDGIRKVRVTNEALHLAEIKTQFGIK
jgi:hypothetical protein